MAANDFRLHKNVQNPGLTKYYGKHADSEQADVLISEWGGRRIGVNANSSAYVKLSQDNGSLYLIDEHSGTAERTWAFTPSNPSIPLASWKVPIVSLSIPPLRSAHLCPLFCSWVWNQRIRR